MALKLRNQQFSIVACAFVVKQPRCYLSRNVGTDTQRDSKVISQASFHFFRRRKVSLEREERTAEVEFTNVVVITEAKISTNSPF
jgi:hypothetical protein